MSERGANVGGGFVARALHASCVGLVCACASVNTSAPVQDPVVTTQDTEVNAAQPWASGSLVSVYRGRFASDESDHDLRELLTLDLGHADRDEWSASVLSEARIDLDGHESANSPFFGLDDSRDAAIQGRLYEAWVAHHSIQDLPVARVGRQLVYDTPITLWFDGARLETREFGPWRVRFGAHGGVPARVYESAHAGDVLAGAFVETRPAPGTRLRLDGLYIEDEEVFGERVNDLFALSIGQSFGARLRFDANASMLEGEARDAQLRASWYDAESDVSLQASWYELLQEQNELTLELDAFTNVLLAQFPYAQAQVLASKGFGSGWSVQAGYDTRHVSDEDDVGTFNRDFDRGFATLSADELLPADLALAVTGEVWDSDGNDIRTWGLDLSRAFATGWRASIGTYYSLYKTDLALLEEREDVRTYFARIRWKCSDALSFDARAEHEHSLEDYGTIRVGVTWRF